jgi:hypothetical protein
MTFPTNICRKKIADIILTVYLKNMKLTTL